MAAHPDSAEANEPADAGASAQLPGGQCPAQSDSAQSVPAQSVPARSVRRGLRRMDDPEILARVLASLLSLQ
jgi:hypothetical protein